MKLAIVGATGMVGTVMLEVLKERNFKYDQLLLVASKKSVGKTISYLGKHYSLIDLEMALEEKPDIAIFSAGGNTSLNWAPKFAKIGTTVIDNSSAWRMDPSKKLIIPEINGNLIDLNDKIIANPNYQIHQNAIPHCDDFLENGYTKEEMKLSNETNKILDKEIKVTATAVRIPVMGGHSESINIEFKNSVLISDVRSILSTTSGVTVQDTISKFEYPMPYYSSGKDDVFVGRIREDFSCTNSINLWIVADNLRKGAATNAIQIAEKVVKKFF